MPLSRRAWGRLVALLSALGCATAGAALPTVGCNGTGTTPVCTFPDGADDPEAGCGELVEAAAPDGSEDSAAPETGDSSSVDADSGPVQTDAGTDTGAPPVLDSGRDSSSEVDSSVRDAGMDVGTETDSAIADARHDARG